jgi:hypothetical protein
LNHPLRQRAPVFLECTKLTLLNTYRTFTFCDQCAGLMLFPCGFFTKNDDNYFACNYIYNAVD